MNSNKKTVPFFGIPIVRHFLFWLGVYAYFVGTVDMVYYSGYQEVIEHFAIYVFSQVIVAYTCLYFLIPHFLTPKRHIQFTISLLLLLVGVFIVFVGFHEYYHIPKYLQADNNSIYDSNKVFLNKLFNFKVFLGKSAIILTPTILLVIAKFYKNQQKYLQLNEQKIFTELTILKHQLNPHFLFNTLNNLYALSIDKSDQAPEVIEKLSEMLDYMLYGCNDTYVLLQKEIELIENYLALEKVRYGKRVVIQFDKSIEYGVKIAPLILLTFIENAFKHGVSQELKSAFIKIDISSEAKYIHFNITNSITKNKMPTNKERIGLSNVKKQLELLYLETFFLDIKEENECFNVHLKLPVK